MKGTHICWCSLSIIKSTEKKNTARQLQFSLSNLFVHQEDSLVFYSATQYFSVGIKKTGILSELIVWDEHVIEISFWTIDIWHLLLEIHGCRRFFCCRGCMWFLVWSREVGWFEGSPEDGRVFISRIYRCMSSWSISPTLAINPT